MLTALKTNILIKAVIFLGFAIWLEYLLQTGSIHLYLSPNLTWLSKLSALLLLILTLAMLKPSKHRSEHDCCEHTHSHSEHSYVKVIIFCVPLFLGFSVKPQILGSAALTNSINTAGSLPFYVTQFSHSGKTSSAAKWLNWNSFEAKISNLISNKSSVTKIPTNVSAVSANSPTTCEETDLAQLALSDHPEQLYNRSYRISGFVYKDPRLGKNQFVLTRYVITCCIIDAQPIGIIAESPDAPNLKANTWLTVEGVLKKRTINNSEKIKPVYNFQAADNISPYLIVTKSKNISIPQEPYLTIPQ